MILVVQSSFFLQVLVSCSPVLACSTYGWMETYFSLLMGKLLVPAVLSMPYFWKRNGPLDLLQGLNHKTACGTPLSVGLPATSRKGRSRPSSATLDLLKKS
ncbi:uncharacterized protein WM294_000584 isoform 1-T1 [Sarcoramphus papa]